MEMNHEVAPLTPTEIFQKQYNQALDAHDKWVSHANRLLVAMLFCVPIAAVILLVPWYPWWSKCVASCSLAFFVVLVAIVNYKMTACFNNATKLLFDFLLKR